MNSRRRAGFSLVELMVTLAVATILTGIAAPAMQDLIAGQKVRTAASALMTDLSYARNDAVSSQRRVAIVRLDQLHDAWSSGWKVQACMRTPACASCSDPVSGDPACLEQAIYRQALGGRVRLCTRMNATTVDTPALIFNPDGRLMDTAAGASLHVNGFMVSDDMGDGDTSNDRLRSLEFGPTGRVSVHDLAAPGGRACP